MFTGDGFGVGLSVQPAAQPELFEGWPVPEGVVARPSRLTEVLPSAGRSDAQLARDLQCIGVLEAQLAAFKAERICALAARRPDTDDPRDDHPGAPSPGWAPDDAVRDVVPVQVSEFFADELALIAGTSRMSAGMQFRQSATLCHLLPGTWAALADGRLDWPRGRAIAAEVAMVAHAVEPSVVAEVETAVLPTAQDCSVTGLKTRVRAELLVRDAAAADARRRTVQRSADVSVRPFGDGTAELAALMPLELAEACRDVVHTHALAAKRAGDAHPIGQLRAGVLADSVMRPWDTSRPPVTAHLHVTAPLDGLVQAAADPSSDASGGGSCTADDDGGGFVGMDATFRIFDRDGAPRRPPRFDEREPAIPPADVAALNGQPITHAHLRALLEKLDALCPGGLRAPAGGSLDIALTDPDSGALRAVTTRDQLERLVRRGCPAHPGEGRGTEAVIGDCGCAVLDRPPKVDRYRPSAAQVHYVRTRDQRCRQPGCTSRAGWADADHVVPHGAGGQTACTNLCCLCRRHHRLKTHAHGWVFVMSPDGVLTVTTPSGITRTTRPPGLAVTSPPPDPGMDDPPPF